MPRVKQQSQCHPDIPHCAKGLCKPCYRKEIKPPGSQRRDNIKRKFGISLEMYDVMLWIQGGGCAICGAKQNGDRHLAVDHDHRAGLVRGVLCASCNTGIGQLRDSPGRLRAAAAYLESYS